MRAVFEFTLAVCAGLRCESAGEEEEADGDDAHFGLGFWIGLDWLGWVWFSFGDGDSWGEGERIYMVSCFPNWVRRRGRIVPIQYHYLFSLSTDRLLRRISILTGRIMQGAI